VLISMNLERALRWAAVCHQGQTRKGSGVPYVEHVVGVAMILDRLGFAEEVVVAGLLHDVVEDTEATLDDVRERFGDEVASVVALCSEVKLDDQGRKRPWIDRKRDHLAALADAPTAARAVILADKLHNLVSIACDLRDGRPVWSQFNAERDQVLWYYRASIDAAGRGDLKLDALAAECRRALDEVESLGPPARS
jgi:(p)ppGpp synthase/HD superfamily hydrolase